VAQLFNPIKPEHLSPAYYARYLALLFTAVLEELEAIAGEIFITREALALAWHSHLLGDDKPRERIYQKVLDRIDSPEPLETEVSSNTMRIQSV